MENSSAVDAAAQALVNRYNAVFGTDFLRLPRLWKGNVACAGLALALKASDNAEACRWLTRVMECWSAPPLADGASGSGEGAPAAPPETVAGVLGRWQDAWDSVVGETLRPLPEALDVTLFLLTGQVSRAVKSVDMRVLFVVGTN
jgi:hypothetical protein